ncbi:MAG: DNA-binding protein [Desulfobulbaceae bacterium]|jgi:hypothetical protein|nr:DNA-binding protein [Desulfobulbaceae bacterium]
MSGFSFIAEKGWRCAACDLALEPRPVQINYLHSVFTVELLTCPGCGFALVPEELATGKMLEVEQLLEDK